MAIGALCHVEIRTRSIAKATEFYGSVFDWSFKEFVPSSYVFIDTGASPAGAFAGVADVNKPLGTNNGICNYFHVADCAASEALVTSLGGRILVSQMEVPGMGRFGVTVDPWGNEVGLWEPAAGAPQPEPSNAAGANRFCWVELSCPNLEAATSYYQKIFGWKLNSSGGTEYAWTEHSGDTVGVGLMSGAMAEHVKGVTTYIDCTDLATYAAKVEKAGGRSVFGP